MSFFLVLIPSLGRRTRAGQSRVVPQETTPECGSRAPLMECMKILNILAKDLHEEAKCIRSEISEIHDSFGAESNGQSEARHQLIELSKYVRILEYRLKQVNCSICELNWDASFRWSCPLCFPVQKSDEMPIGKTRTTLT